MTTSTLESQYAAAGYLHIKRHFLNNELDSVEDAIIRLYHMQARKIEEYSVQADWVMARTDFSRYDKITKLVEMMEGNDKEALYQTQKFFASSPAIRSFYNQPFVNFCAQLMGVDEATTLVEGPGLFINEPGVTRLLYHWHTEALYYSKRRRFMNVWLPLFGDRTTANGAMAIMPTSHKRVWDASLMSEYAGYEPGDSKKANQFWQLEIPSNFLGDYKRHSCESQRGDVILFDRNLVHTSVPNQTNSMAFALVCRVWNPADDLTLSGNCEAKAYGGNTGRANLLVKP